MSDPDPLDFERQRNQLGIELREAAASLDRGEGVEVDMEAVREMIRQRYAQSIGESAVPDKQQP